VAPKKNHHPNKPHDESIKETFESIIIAFILAFVFRAYVVEAFVIPTGSMAPTLLGHHFPISCVQCGYRFDVDTPPRHEQASRLANSDEAVCPMCHYPNILIHQQRISAGDRILVQKYIYSLVEPRRWDIAVFKPPYDPNTNFIKRLVGLPNESLWVIEGNVYTKPNADNPTADWSIARKTLRPKVQQNVWQPIYHSQYVPLDGGHTSPGRGQHPWLNPWLADNISLWNLNTHHRYRYKSSDTGRLRFDFSTARRGGRGQFPYNQLKFKRRPPGTFNQPPIEDVRIAAAFKPDTTGLAVTISTTARLDDLQGLPHRLQAHITADGFATLIAQDPRTGQTKQLVPSTDVGPFTVDAARTVELWYVDQQASLWIDQKRQLTWSFDLPIEVIKSRRPPADSPAIGIEVSGAPVNLYRVEVDRDLYYTSYTAQGTPARRSALLKTSSGYVGEPIQLLSDQFFFLGDNSPLSHDSRFWDQIDPWVDRRYYDPSAANHDSRFSVVSRRLIMGRAFFVYFPAPLRYGPTLPAIFPNFGDMRFIR